MSQTIRLALSQDMPPERLARITRDLSRDLSRAGVGARPVEGQAGAAERGLLTELGQLAVELLSTAGVAAALDVLKGYVSRERKLTIAVELPAGGKFTIDGSNIDSAELRAMLQSVIRAAK